MKFVGQNDVALAQLELLSESTKGVKLVIVGAMTISLLSFIREALKASIAIVETSPIKNFIKGRAAFIT